MYFKDIGYLPPDLSPVKLGKTLIFYYYSSKLEADMPSYSHSNNTISRNT